MSDHGPDCCCRTCLPADTGPTEPAPYRPNWPPVLVIPEDTRHPRTIDTEPDGMLVLAAIFGVPRAMLTAEDLNLASVRTGIPIHQLLAVSPYLPGWGYRGVQPMAGRCRRG